MTVPFSCLKGTTLIFRWSHTIVIFCEWADEQPFAKNIANIFAKNNTTQQHLGWHCSSCILFFFLLHDYKCIWFCPTVISCLSEREKIIQTLRGLNKKLSKYSGGWNTFVFCLKTYCFLKKTAFLVYLSTKDSGSACSDKYFQTSNV